MTLLQAVVLIGTVLLLGWLFIQTIRPEPERAPRNALIYPPHECAVCWRRYRTAEALHFHLYGRDGEGQHGRLPQIKPLEIDGDACVGVPTRSMPDEAS